MTTKMKRLFQVVEGGTTNYFGTKHEAKAYRDRHPGTHVSRGPDHYLGVSRRQRFNKWGELCVD